MPSEYCPLCRTAVNMSATITPRTIAGKDGKMTMMTDTTYHCESCGSFVRSITDDENVAAA